MATVANAFPGLILTNDANELPPLPINAPTSAATSTAELNGELRQDRTLLRSALKSAANSRFNLGASANELNRSTQRVAFDGMVKHDTMERKSIVDLTKPTANTRSLDDGDEIIRNGFVAPYLGSSPVAVNPMDKEHAETRRGDIIEPHYDNTFGPQKDIRFRNTARPVSAASSSPRAAMSMRAISANGYHKQVKLTGFEFRRNPVIEALAEQLIETRRQETEHLNRLFLLRLTNPWSSIKNSELLFSDYSWNEIHRSHRASLQRPKTSPATRKHTDKFAHQQNQPPPEPTRRDKYFAKLATPRPKHANEPLPADIPRNKSPTGPPDLHRLELLARPRQIHPPYVAPEVFPGCTDLARRRPVKVREMDPQSFARLTRPKIIVRPEDVEPAHVPVVVRSKMGDRLMKGVKSRLGESVAARGNRKGEGFESLESVRLGEAADSFEDIGGEGRFTVGARPSTAAGKKNGGSVSSGNVHSSLGTSTLGVTGLNKGDKGEIVKSQILMDMYAVSASNLNLSDKDMSGDKRSIYTHGNDNVMPSESIQDQALNVEVIPERLSDMDPSRLQTETNQQPEIQLTSAPDDSTAHEQQFAESTPANNAAATKLQSTFRGYQLRKRLSMVEPDRKWDLRPSTALPPFNSTRPSISQGEREEGPSSLGQSMHILRNFTGSIMEVDEAAIAAEEEASQSASEFFGVDVVGASGANFDQQGEDGGNVGDRLGIGKKLLPLASTVEGRSANISVVGSTVDSERNSQTGTNPVMSRESVLNSVVAVNGGSFGDVIQSATTSQTNVPGPSEKEAKISRPQSARLSVTASAETLKKDDDPAGRSGSLRDSIAKSFRGSAVKISSALGFSKKSLESQEVEVEKGQDIVPAKISNSDNVNRLKEKVPDRIEAIEAEVDTRNSNVAE